MGKNKKHTRMKLSDQIRQAIDTSELSRYRIAKETGISHAMMSRFMSGERGFSMDSLDVLADYLGMNITIDKNDR
jgi:predicted XRE-type DNA-binding protein